MHITIENENVKVRNGISKKSGQPYTLREQAAVVHGVGRFPVEFNLTLPDGVDGYKAGTYEATTPFTVGRYGLEISRDLGLVQVQKKQAA